MTKVAKCGQPAAKAGTTSSSDGGRTALSGFLYQILGVLGLRVTGNAESGGTDASGLFSIVTDETAIIHEAYDSDVGLLLPLVEGAKQGVVLAQFKYSIAGSQSAIPPVEFKDILTRFHVAANAVTQDGKALAENYLVTNRVYSRDTKKIIKSVTDNESSTELDSDQNVIARSLQLVQGIQPDDWTNRLYAFGRQYGLTDRETQTGIDRLLGRVLVQTVLQPQCALTRSTLIECLTDSIHAKSLKHADLLPELAWSLREMGETPPHTIIERPEAERLYAQYKDRALVVCTGDGGTGKTAAARKWAHSTVRTHFVGARRVSRITNDWIVRLVDEWRGVQPSHDTPQSAIQRLARANPAIALPLLHLSIDGIDERCHVGMNTDDICKVLDWFWREDELVRQGHKNQPDARLLVTCRNIQEFAKFWYPNTAGSCFTDPEMPPVIPFAYFTDSEFEALLLAESAKLAQPVYERLLRSVSRAESATADNDTGPASAAPALFSRYEQGGSELLLRHPAIWEAFIGLPQNQQVPFLNSDPVACATLAGQYVARFLEKASRRAEGLTRDSIEMLFCKLALASQAQASAMLQRKLWNEVIRNEGFVDMTALRLFDEAYSAGIIEKDYDRWRWRYSFVERYLAGLHDGGAK